MVQGTGRHHSRYCNFWSTCFCIRTALKGKRPGAISFLPVSMESIFLAVHEMWSVRMVTVATNASLNTHGDRHDGH